MNKHVRHWIIGLAKYGIGFGLLAFVLWQNWENIRWLIQQPPDIVAFAALAAIAVTCTSIQFVRWYILVRALDLPFTLGAAFRLGLVGAYYNAFLPGSVGGDLVKAYYIARDQPGRRASAVATVLADRLIGLFGLLWFAAAFGGGFWLAGDTRIAGNDYLKGIVRVCSGLAGATVIGWAVLGLLPLRRADRFAQRLAHIPKLGHTLAELWYAVWTYRQRAWAVYATVAMTAVVHVGFVFMFHLAVRVFPADGPATLPEHFVIAPIGYIAQAFFPAPGGVGGGEAIFGRVLYKEVLGRDEATGVIGRLTLRVVEWSIGLVGLVLFLRMRDVLPVVEDEAEKEGYGGHDDTPGDHLAAGPSPPPSPGGIAPRPSVNGVSVAS